jgi:hypothetical protein
VTIAPDDITAVALRDKLRDGGRLLELVRARTQHEVRMQSLGSAGALAKRLQALGSTAARAS